MKHLNNASRWLATTGLFTAAIGLLAGSPSDSMDSLPGILAASVPTALVLGILSFVAFLVTSLLDKTKERPVSYIPALGLGALALVNIVLLIVVRSLATGSAFTLGQVLILGGILPLTFAATFSSFETSARVAEQKKQQQR
ncbi:MAG: hypothetical protein Q4D73_06270 [Actinomycetaceae bacterium]|nr:hypothetical protein [Actinomycetaceae bacterium]